MLLIQIPDNSTIADTIATVFRDSAYGSQAPSLADMILRWITGALASVMGSMAENPLARTIVRWTLIIAAVLLIARIIFVLILHYQSQGLYRWDRRSSGKRYDPWSEAHQFAASGRYTDAAHSLYSALLSTMARRGRITLHESKTAGDYLRELRGGTFFHQFGDFARLYESVMYGVGTCDATKYDRLRELALPLIETRA